MKTTRNIITALIIALAASSAFAQGFNPANGRQPANNGARVGNAAQYSQKAGVSVEVQHDGGLKVTALHSAEALGSGLKRGDVIYFVNGTSATGVASLEQALATGPAQLRVLRGGGLGTFVLTAAKPKPRPRPSNLTMKIPGLGLAIEKLSDGRMRVQSVNRNGKAQFIGVRVGDILREINRKPVAGVNWANETRGSFEVGVYRPGTRQQVWMSYIASQPVWNPPHQPHHNDPVWGPWQPVGNHHHHGQVIQINPNDVQNFIHGLLNP